MFRYVVRTCDVSERKLNNPRRPLKVRSSTRQQLVLELAKLVEENAQLLAALATLETGVPLARTRSEVDLDHETGPW